MSDPDKEAIVDSGIISLDLEENGEHISSSLEEIRKLHLDEINENNAEPIAVLEDEPNCSTVAISSLDEEYERDQEWLGKNKHIFVLSSAGKPIYSRYGNEDRFASYFGIMQAIVSFIQADNDSIKSVHAGDTNFVFLFKDPLILVAVSKTDESVSQLLAQLNAVFNQIASVLTLTRLQSIYEQRRNYDFRRLLTGVERLIDHLVEFAEIESAFLLGAIQCLPLVQSVRETISSAIVQSCSKIKNLVFGILLANNQLITLVRMKNYKIHPNDLHLIFNLVQASESLKSAEIWAPLCLPDFDGSGFLYAHVSYLSEDCQACLLLLTVDKYAFFALSEAKQRIVEKLRRGNCMEAINESMCMKEEVCARSGFPELRHFLYKNKPTAQFYQPGLSPPYVRDKKKLMQLYRRAHNWIHNSERTLKLLYEQTSEEVILAWNTGDFELYTIFEPLVDTNATIGLVSRLLNWIKKRETTVFQLSAPTF